MTLRDGYPGAHWAAPPILASDIDREVLAHPGQPAFVHIMTTSNHRPFTYPEGRIDIPSKTGRDGGVKYTGNGNDRDPTPLDLDQIGHHAR